MCLFISTILSGQSLASWYGGFHHGKITASGQKYNMYGYTCAHKKLKLGTKLLVTNLSNNKSVVVIVNDRGPYIKGRILDLSYSAFKAISSTNKGVISVKYEVL